MLQRLVAILSSQSIGVALGFLFVALVLCGFGLPMPEDVFLITGGVLARLAAPHEHYTTFSMLGDPGLLAMMAVGLAGILTGDSVIYLAGRRLGKRVADFRLLRHMAPPEKLARVEKLLQKRGPVVVMIARFLPGLRAPTYFTVGHSRVPYRIFLMYDGLAALVSAPLWVGLGFRFGHHLERAARGPAPEPLGADGRAVRHRRTAGSLAAAAPREGAERHLRASEHRRVSGRAQVVG